MSKNPPTDANPAGPRERALPRRRLRALPLALGGTVLLAVAAVAVSWLSRDRSMGPPTLESRPVQVRGGALPLLGPGPDPAIGARMPGLLGASFDGTPVSIANDGSPKVVIFLAHWCPHCQREVPELTAWLRQSGPPRTVELYSVATATSPDRPNYPPSEWLKRERWPLPVLADDAGGDAARAAGLSAYPFFVFVDRRGEIVARHAGELTVEELEKMIDVLRQAPGPRSRS